MIGPVSNIVGTKNEFIMNAWRSAILVIYLLIPAIVEYRYKKKEDYAPLFNWKEYGIFTIVHISFAAWNLGIVYSGLMLI